MGDGRFYSSEQFFSILFLTTFIIALSVMVMLYYYKSSGKNSNKRVLVPGVMLGMLLLANFIEEIALTEETGMVLKGIAGLCLLATNIYVLRLLAIKHYDLLRFKWVALVSLAFVSLVLWFKPKWIVSSYEFNQFHYGTFYKSMMIALGLAGLCVILFQLKKFGKDFLFSAGLVLWVLPLNLYSGMLILSGRVTKPIEYGLYVFIATYICLTADHYLPYRISAAVFDDVKKLMTDYVVITDEQGELMYYSNSVASTGLFRVESRVDLQQIESFFKVPVTMRLDYGRQIMVVEEERINYLSYTRKAIKDHGIDVGYILTFMDTTELIQMLDQLKKEQSEMETTHRLLVSHKEVVYEVEKEKEINSLLNEIASNQALSMRSLKIELDTLLSEEIKDKELTALLIKAQKDLNDVRAAVKTYVDYYTEE